MRNKLPSKWEMLKNLVGAAGDIIENGIEQRSTEDIDIALKICALCPHFIANQWRGRCGQCGCKTSIKVTLKAWHCPLGKW